MAVLVWRGPTSLASLKNNSRIQVFRTTNLVYRRESKNRKTWMIDTNLYIDKPDFIEKTKTNSFLYPKFQTLSIHPSFNRNLFWFSLEIFGI